MSRLTHDLNYVIDRLESMTNAQTSISVYDGHLDGSSNAPIRMKITPERPKDNSSFKKGLSTFRDNFEGAYTFVMQPSKEVIYVVHELGNGGLILNPDQSLNGSNKGSNIGVNEQVQLLLKLEKLTLENKALQEKIKELESTEHKFNNIVTMALERFGLAGGEKIPTSTGALNSSQQSTINKTMAEDTEEQTEDLTELEKACCVLIDLFGEDTLIQIAMTLQQNPSKVQLVKSFLS